MYFYEHVSNDFDTLIKFEGLDGSEIDFAVFKGKKLMVVNVWPQNVNAHPISALQEIFEALE